MKKNEWIRESNLIEDINDPLEDACSVRAWNWFLKQPLSLDTIRGLHKQITRKQLGKEAGVFRVCGVTVGGRICPHYELVPGLMARWLRLHAEDDLWSSIKSAHVTFEMIHPFVDGNGRTGRMIMNYQRVIAGLSPLCIKASERQEYYKWFQ